MMSSSAAIAGSWATLPTALTPWILDVVLSMGHTKMTPVQASTIPLFMKHRDVVVEAVTGSGKTLAFVIPILERLERRESKLRKNEIGALIITPTRELATQIHSVLTTFLCAQLTSLLPVDSRAPPDPPTKPVHPPALLLVSSETSSPSQDIDRFASTGADIVIGTPGRVEEFLLGKGRNAVSVKELEVLVLDEADRLLDLGFQAVLARILNHLPKQRRTGLFSATMTDADALSELVRVSLRNPTRVVVKVQSKTFKSDIAQDMIVSERRIPANLRNYYLPCRASEKLVQLTRIIGHEISERQSSQFIIYFATCACVDYFYRILPSILPKSTSLFSIHGHLTPTARTRSLTAFSLSASTASAPSILLATDVAARGLDLPHVDTVLQFDPPADTKTFSHRCGRTARAGRSGSAWVLLTGREVEYVDFMAVRKIPLVKRGRFNADGSECPVVDDDAEHPEDPAVSTYLAQIRKVLFKDRAMHDKAAKSFVSFVRAYSKHEASYIFRVKDLDLVGVAMSFGLLRLPKMPELKDRDGQRWVDADVDWGAYAYADKAKEAKRQAAAAGGASALAQREQAKARRAEKKQANAAWSTQAARKEAKEVRKQKKDRKRKWLSKSQGDPAPAALTQGEKERAAESDVEDDWDDLAHEEREAKKVRRGVVSQETFDEQFMDM